MANMSDRLAAELKFEVAEHLWRDYDATSLRALSLVSHNWIAPAQSYLFRHLTLRVAANKTVSNLAIFFHTYSHLAQYVFEMLLIGTGDREEVDFGASHLFTLIAFAPALRHLKIFSAVIMESKSKLRRIPRNISLTLDHVDLFAADLYILMEQCAGPIVNLINISVVLTPEAATLPPSAVGASRQTLNVQRICAAGANLPRWSISEVVKVCPGTVKTFGIEWMFFSEFTQSIMRARNFLLLNADHLERLQLNFEDVADLIGGPTSDVLVKDRAGEDGFGGIDPSWSTISLSECCPRLKTFTMLLNVGQQRSYANTEDPLFFINGFFVSTQPILVWRYALRLLASAHSRNCLEYLNIGLNFRSRVSAPCKNLEESTLRFLDWKKWDEVLSGFKSLKELRFMCMTDFGEKVAFHEPYTPRGRFPIFLQADLESLAGIGLPSLRKRVAFRFE